MKELHFLLVCTFLLLSACGLTEPKAGSIHTSDVDGMQMVFIPAGAFEIGSEDEDSRADEDEKPLHTIYLDAYWIDQTEVTNKMYVECMNTGSCRAPARSAFYLQGGYQNHPVVGVSWDQANAYCGWANRRLPTEAEWEKAARGIDGRIYPWGNINPNNELLNFDHFVDETTAVGSYPKGASPYGALDMGGNAWEWVQDGYSPDYYLRSPQDNPLSTSPVNLRVLRGGNWDSNAEGVRSANRFWAFPGRNDTDGFRCAKSD